jgi:hypothetical protein
MKKTLSVIFFAAVASFNVSADGTVLVEDIPFSSFQETKIPNNFGLSLTKDTPTSTPVSSELKYEIINSSVADINHKTKCGYELSNIKYSVVYSYDANQMKTLGADPENVKQLAQNTIESTITEYIVENGTLVKKNGMHGGLHMRLVSDLSYSLSNFVEEIKDPVLIQNIIASEYDETGNCEIN